MSLVREYRTARASEEAAMYRRAVSLRAMVATGLTQREIAAQLNISQPAVSQQLRGGERLSQLTTKALFDVARPILVELALAKGFTRLGVFGSVARGEARSNSDLDLIAEAPEGATIGDILDLKEVIESTLGRTVDLVTYGGLDPDLDRDILRDLELL